jgi:hypothetical protein
VETLFALFAAGTPALLLHPRATANERTALVERTLAVPEPPEAKGPFPSIRVPERLDPESIAASCPRPARRAPQLARLQPSALVAAARQRRAPGVEPDDRWLVALPLAHVAGSRSHALGRRAPHRRAFDPEGRSSPARPLATALAGHRDWSRRPDGALAD